MTAAADVLSDYLRSTPLSSLHGLESENLISAVSEKLDVVPSYRWHCVEACVEAIHAAFADFRQRQVEEFRGEKALICTCFGVTEEVIEAYVEQNRPETVAEVTNVCRAGGGCGSCRMLIQEIIDAALLTERSQISGE